MWNKLSFGTRLLLVILVPVLISLVLFSFTIFINESMREQDRHIEQMQSIARIVATNSEAAILFNDRDTTREILGALESIPTIVYAVISTPEETAFSQYGQASPDQINFWFRQLEQQNPYIGADHAAFRYHIKSGEEILATLYMATDVAHIRRNIIDYAVILVVIVIVIFALIYWLSRIMRRNMMAPIERLRNTMAEVTQDHSYSPRFSVDRDDEIGELYRGFNHMLDVIAAREAELSQHQQELERQVEVRTRQILELDKKRLEWLENIAHFLKHELKNSIVGFKSSIDLIERRHRKGRDIEELITRARRSLGFMGRLLDSVGGASTLEAALYSDERTQLSLKELIDEKLDEYGIVYDQNSFLFEADFTANIIANEGHIGQLLDKLISNAVDHAEHDTPIKIGLRTVEDQIELCVENQGPHLPENRKHIFDWKVSFGRSDHARDEHFGVGLYVVQMIATAHDGSVRAENLHDPDGARFVVTLPHTQVTAT